MEGARALTGARSGVITTIDERGQVQDFVTSGLPPEERRMMLEWPDGPRLFEHLRDLPTPLRVANLPGYLGSLGLPSNPWGAKTLQGTPMHHGGEHLGHFFLADKEDGEAFTAEDEEILVLFASQAATAIANTRTHLDVERARASLEALVETSPVGVVVFDARTGRPVSFNREAQRIVEEIRTPGHPTEQLLEVMTFRHADGPEISLEEFPLARQLEGATTTRAEEIELSVPDGRSVRTLINVTPIHSEEGELVSVVVTMQDLGPLEELERQRAEFLGMVSHELRAPLTSIKGSTATVLGAAPTPPQAEMLQFFRIIDGQADHMSGLIANLLDAGSIEAGTLTVAPEPSSVAVLVDRARNTFLSGGGRHPVLVDLPPDLPRAMADPDRIAQVLEQPARRTRHGKLAAVVADPRRGGARRQLHRALGLGRGPGHRARPAPASLQEARRPRRRHRARARDLEGPRRGTRRPHPGRERRDGPGRALHLHDPGGRRRPRGGLAPRPAAPARGEGGEDARPRGGRRPADAPLRPGSPLRCGLRAARHGRSGRAGRPHPRREAPPRPPRPDAPRDGRDRADEAGPPVGRSPGHLHLRLRPGRDHRKGVRERRGRLHRQAVLANRARGARPGGAPGAGPSPRLSSTGSSPSTTACAASAWPAARSLSRPRNSTSSRTLSLNAGRVMTTDVLLRQVWGRRGSDDTDRVRTVVKKLRAKLGDNAAAPTYIFTEHGVGYRMATPGEA